MPSCLERIFPHARHARHDVPLLDGHVTTGILTPLSLVSPRFSLTMVRCFHFWSADCVSCAFLAFSLPSILPVGDECKS